MSGTEMGKRVRKEDDLFRKGREKLKEREGRKGGKEGGEEEGLNKGGKGKEEEMK
jgi:hypothetical protein